MVDGRSTDGWGATGWSTRFGRRRRGLAVLIAGLLALVGVATLPASQGVSGEARATPGVLIGEHSSLGTLEVDAWNSAIRSVEHLRGEHAGIALTDYEAESAWSAQCRS